jgi:hypothetical protein
VKELVPMAGIRTRIGQTIEALGRRIAGGTWASARAKLPTQNSITWACRYLSARARQLLDEYKELGEDGVTEAEGQRMEEIIAELRDIGDAWNASGCRVLHGDVTSEVAPTDPHEPGAPAVLPWLDPSRIPEAARRALSPDQ